MDERKNIPEKTDSYLDHLDEAQKILVQSAKKELDRITYDLPDDEIDPDKIKALVEVIKQYEKPDMPEGFGEEEFFQRFQEKNLTRILGEQEKVIELQNSRRNRTIKKEHQFRRRFSVAVASFLLLVSGVIINQITYADGNKDAFRLVEEKDNSLYLQSNLNPDFFNKKNENIITYSAVEVTFEEFVKSFKDDLYLPKEILDNLDKCRFQFLEGEDKTVSNYFISYSDTVTKQYTNMDIIKLDEEQQQLSYSLDANNVLIDVDCGTVNCEVYYNTEYMYFSVVVQCGLGHYLITSNKNIDDVLYIVQSMEVYK